MKYCYYVNMEICSKKIEFRMLGTKYNNDRWILSILDGVSMYIGIIGPLENNIIEFVENCTYSRTLLDKCYFICGNKKVKIHSFKFTDLRYDDSVFNLMKVADLRLNRLCQKQEDSKLIHGTIVCHSGSYV